MKPRTDHKLTSNYARAADYLQDGIWLISGIPHQRDTKNYFLGTSFNLNLDMKNQLMIGTISALSKSFKDTVALGIYEKRQIVRVSEPSKINEAFYQALHWQFFLQISSNPEHVEAGKKERKLAQHIFVSYFIPCLSCISHMALQKWLALCFSVNNPLIRAGMADKLTPGNGTIYSGTS